MAIGRPIELTPNITSKNISVACTEGQTEFTVTDGYRINELAVYRNGVRLVDGRDFSATDGTTVTLISDTVVADDIIEFSVFDSFDVAGVIVSASSTQAVNGNLHITGELYAGSFKPTGLVAAAATFNSALHVGSALTANAAGDVETIGIITAATASFGAGTFSGAVNVDATTDSTSTTTGALIVDGGAAIAKNVYIGAGLSVAGTLTYEDVTNVDSVGLITAKSGVNVSGGQVTIGTGITMGIAGVATFSGTGDVHLLDNVRLNVGDGSDLTLYHDASHSYVRSDSVALRIRSNDLRLQSATGEEYFYGVADGGAHLYHDNSLKLQTTGDGITVTGEVTATGVDVTSNLIVGSGITMGSAGVATFSGTADIHLHDGVRLLLGTGSDLRISHDGSHAYIQENTGNLRIDADTLQLRSSAGENYLYGAADGAVTLYHDSSAKLATTNEGIEVTGFTSTTAGMGVTGGLFEGAWIKAGKLTDNLQIGIATANVFYFTTTETTTGTPNIRWDDTYSLSSKMAVGDVASVTVIATAAAAGYCANWTIDGNAVTEEWVGGSAPSAGGADGLDIYSFTIIKTGTGTGDSGFKVIANVSNAT